MSNELDLGCYEELFNTFSEISGYTSYLYKKQENSKHYGWTATYHDCLPEFEEIAKKYGDGMYKLSILKTNEDKTQMRVCRSFIIDDYYKKQSTAGNSDIKQLIEGLIPLIQQKKDERVIDQVSLVNDIMKNQVKNYSDIMKDIRSQNNFIQNDDDQDDEDEDEDDEGDEMNLNFIYPLLDEYAPKILGDTSGQMVKQLFSNPIAKSILNHIISNSVNLGKVKNYLVKKIGAESTEKIINSLM